jgi:hypothetical protein
LWQGTDEIGQKIETQSTSGWPRLTRLKAASLSPMNDAAHDPPPLSAATETPKTWPALVLAGTQPILLAMSFLSATDATVLVLKARRYTTPVVCGHIVRQTS